MAGKPFAGDAITSQFAGMSKTQLYDVMFQMKNLIEQNQQQARQILVDNPMLTKALFQAQIMLGMVQPPQAIPSIQQPLSQPQQQPMQQSQPPVIQPAALPPSQPSRTGQANSSQPQNFPRPAHTNQPMASLPIPGVTLPSQAALQQPRIQLNAQASSFSSHPSQAYSGPALPLNVGTPQSSAHQAPHISSQGQLGVQTPGMHHQSMQPPPSLHLRGPSSQPFSQHGHTQMGSNLYQASQPPLPHSLYPSGSTLQASSGYPHGQTPLPGQLPHHQLYQKPPIGNEYSSSQGMISGQIDRGTPWLPGPPDAGTGARLSGPPPFIPSQMVPSVNPSNLLPSRPSQITPEMEKALIQQVMSLKPEQINLLPPEQRQQVMHLQQMLR